MSVENSLNFINCKKNDNPALWEQPGLSSFVSARRQGILHNTSRSTISCCLVTLGIWPSLLDCFANTMAKQPVGEFYVHILRGQHVLPEMISSNRLLKITNRNRPSVIHFYDGG